MNSDTPLDYALFQLSPKRSHCELFVFGDGRTEKLASGLVKPFVAHLKVAEEQVAQAAQSIKLQVERNKKSKTWFKKGTLERFVRFVSTPEVLEVVHSYDSEMSQLEGARKIYSQGMGEQVPGSSGEEGKQSFASGDATKKELLRAIDVRLGVLRQDLTMACARASAAGFSHDAITELLIFSDYFGAHRLGEACEKFSILCQRHPDLAVQHNQPQQLLSKGMAQPQGDRDIRSSSDSDMSLDGPVGNSNPTAIATGIGDKKPNTFQSNLQQHKMPISSTSEQFSVETQEKRLGDNEQVKKLETKSLPNSTEPSGGSRRLSVQDRINLFESKQKEQSGSASVLSVSASSSMGGKTGGRPELRRLPSDVSSSVEKSVLRRWSGASDMSIDVGSGNSNHNKKEHGNTMTAPDCSGDSSTQTSTRNEEKDTASSRPIVDLDEVSQPSAQSRVSSSKNYDQTEDVRLKDDPDLQTHSRPKQGKYQIVELDKESSQQSSQTLLQNQQISSSAILNDSSLDERGTAQANSRTESRVNLVDVKVEKSGAGRRVNMKEKEEPLSLHTSKANNSGSAEAVMVAVSSSLASTEVQGLNIKECPPEFNDTRSKEDTKSGRKARLNMRDQYRTGKADVASSMGAHSSPLSSEMTFSSNLKEISSTSPLSNSFDVSLQGFSKKVPKETKVGNLSHQDTDLHRLASNHKSGIVFQNSRIETSVSPRASKLLGLGKTLSPSTSEPVPTVTLTKGNEALNNDLQMKADELEKLFAEHMLKVSGDLPSNRGKPADSSLNIYPRHVEQRPEVGFPYHLPERSTMKENVHNPMGTDANRALDILNNQDYNLNSKFGDLSFSEDLRGKFYEQYMKKREVKLREEWRSTRASKEAKLKAMQERLEQSSSEMKTKFSGSVDRQNSAVLFQRRAEKLRSFNAYSSTKNKGQQPLKLEKAEENPEGSIDHIDFSYETPSDTFSRSILHRQNSSGQSISSTPRPSSIIDNASTGTTSIGSGRRKVQQENPLAQSVPNFSDLRKENAKPLSAIGKLANRAQARSSTRSRGTREGIAIVKEDKSRRSHALMKGSVSPAELSDLSSVNSDNLMVEQTEQTIFQKGQESKPFLRKGKGIGSNVGVVALKTKASVISVNDDTEEPDYIDPVKDELHIVKEEVYSRTVSAKIASEMDNDMTNNSDDQDSENGDASQLRDDSSPFATLSSELKSSAEAMQESPRESPGSWNSRNNRSFSYAQEASDIDASVDSPIGSPTSWNSHSLGQMMDSEAARMRKKWGVTQKPVFVSNTSNHPKKDVTKGFKGLFKFGRKSKGVDALLPDWVSASTNSEGDEDTEDGHETGNHLPEDMPKSRMGFSQHQSAYDGFSDGRIFHDDGHTFGTSIPAPPASFKLREDHLSGSSLKGSRSFFTLPTFRSKGSESKLR